MINQDLSKAVLYCRVSTNEQKESGCSIEAQKDRCRAYAIAKGWEVVAEIVDAGESGKDLYRDGIRQALNMLSAGKADALIVLKLDRLTRSVRDLGEILETMERQGWSLASVEESLDTSSANGRLALNILISVSQWEREVGAERTRTALESKKYRGEKTGGDREYGYCVKLDKNGKKINTPEFIEQKAITLIIDLRKSGCSFKEIAKKLEKKNYRTARGLSSWNQAALSRICKRHGIISDRKTRKDKGKKRKNGKSAM